MRYIYIYVYQYQYVYLHPLCENLTSYSDKWKIL